MALELYCRLTRQKDKRIHKLLLGCGLVMDCQTAIEYINAYADNMLNKKEAEQLLLHVSSCGKCKKALDDIIAIKRAIAGLDEIKPPAGLAISAIIKAKRRKIPIFAYASAGIAAAIALVAVFSSGIFNNINYTPSDKAAQPAAYSEKMAAGNALQASSEPEEAPMSDLALAPEATAMPEPMPTLAPTMELADGDGNSFSGEVRTASVPFINVPADVSEDFRQALEEFLTADSIEHEFYDVGEIVTVSFVITEDKLEDLKLLIEGSFQYEGKINAGTVEFIFSK